MEIPSTSYSLLAALQAEERSERAWHEFHARYRDVILAWCRRRGLEGDAEDATQEILIKLFQALPRHLHDPALGPFRGWLKTVVENSLRDWWRARQRRPEPAVLGGSTFLNQLGNLADDREGLDELSTVLEEQMESDAAKAVARARARVDEKTWEAFVKLRMEQRPAAEIAQELGLKTGTVYKHIQRVIRILREELQAEDGAPR
jgi:RNA polymerase sigma-70 factor (ECF subfamily)